MRASEAENLEMQQNKSKLYLHQTWLPLGLYCLIAQHISKAQPAVVPETTFDREPSGPVLGPMHEELENRQAVEELSSTSRTFIHDLTLPPVPNLDIPPSPPGSPNPSANAKFAHFLSLKRQDVHFNDKLAGSASLKNPSLLRKLMEHAGIDYQAQYSSSLPPDLWNISKLPSWGYKEELLRAQKEHNAKAEEGRMRGQRNMVEFVPGSSRPDPASRSR